jgi:hypothetical protein
MITLNYNIIAKFTISVLNYLGICETIIIYNYYLKGCNYLNVEGGYNY